MIEDVVEVAIKFFGRVIDRVLIEILFEKLLKGPGYLISKLFIKRDDGPDGVMVITIGIIFWFILSLIAYYILFK